MTDYSSKVMAGAKRAIAGLEMPPASARYVKHKTKAEKHIEALVKERGIESGTIGLRIARKIDRRAVHGQVMRIAGAVFTVKDPAQA
ncbi:hypothetical protein [Litchfieldella xinjiangensis]|uniref:hypothetical protein n=1 Tax=Litchfieldella xinjiangensis TaxID=1166948 RepID=UPI0005BA18C3|nr:hypothetical protein [Halomonas xinjiangensis]